jgi:hypothetical protein
MSKYKQFFDFRGGEKLSYQEKFRKSLRMLATQYTRNPVVTSA